MRVGVSTLNFLTFFLRKTSEKFNKNSVLTGQTLSDSDIAFLFRIDYDILGESFMEVESFFTRNNDFMTVKAKKERRKYYPFYAWQG